VAIIDEDVLCGSVMKNMVSPKKNNAAREINFADPHSVSLRMHPDLEMKAYPWRKAQESLQPIP